MSLKKRMLLLCFAATTAGASAQQIIAGADFATRFDNREYADNTFNHSQTLFSARLTPQVGIQWMKKNRLVFGVELLQNFGEHNGEREPFLSDVKPLIYYRFKTANVQADAGIFDRSELAGDYSTAFFSDSTLFYRNRLSGFLGRYRSTERPDTYVELALDWEGMLGETVREKFRILSAGRYAFGGGGYFGYAFSLFHFATSEQVNNVSDNLLLNPYVGWKFDAYFDFDVRAGMLLAPQRARSVDNRWKKPYGGQLDIAIRKWGVKLENKLYLGQNLQPLRFVAADPETGLTYGTDGLYAGDSFYATTEHIYNRTWLGYENRFFRNTVHIDAGIALHYDGKGLGTQQVVQLSVNLEKLFRTGKKHERLE